MDNKAWATDRIGRQDRGTGAAVRRALTGAGIAALLAAALATPALAGGPTRTPIGEETILYDGYCAFPVLLQDSHASVKELAFAPDADGVERIVYTGVFQSMLTNLDAETTTDVVLGSRVTFTVRPDGTMTATATGSFLLYYTEAEASASELGQGLFLGRGTATESYDADGLVQATFAGSVIDLCDVLADD